MQWRVSTVALSLLLTGFHAGAALACGDSEAPVACGESAEGEARYMLLRVVSAVKTDEAKALLQFSHGEGGFRTQYSYVFCVGPDGVMSAHPNPVLQGQTVTDLHDQTGNYFIATMLKTAKPGAVSEIRYLFPRPGGLVALPKTTYYTRASDQVCGVGVYDGDEARPATPAPPPQDRLQQLRSRITAEMPASLVADWTAFLQAEDDQVAGQAAAVAKAREQVQAAAATLASR